MKQKLKSRIKITGRVKTCHWDASIVPDYRTFLILNNNPVYYQALIKKALVHYEYDKNLFVDDGCEQLIGLMLATESLGVLYCGVGSGTNTPTNADSDLQTPIARVAITDKYPVGSYELHADTFFSTADGNGTWNESGLFTASSAGVMWCRKKFATSYGKTTGNTSTIQWTITFTPVP